MQLRWKSWHNEIVMMQQTVLKMTKRIVFDDMFYFYAFESCDGDILYVNDKGLMILFFTLLQLQN